jgi:hypothetical protein
VPPPFFCTKRQFGLVLTIVKSANIMCSQPKFVRPLVLNKFHSIQKPIRFKKTFRFHSVVLEQSRIPLDLFFLSFALFCNNFVFYFSGTSPFLLAPNSCDHGLWPSAYCWVCVIFFACVCVGASDSTTACHDPTFLCFLCHVRRALPRGVPGGARYAPPGYAQCSGKRPDFFFGGFRYF